MDARISACRAGWAASTDNVQRFQIRGVGTRLRRVQRLRLTSGVYVLRKTSTSDVRRLTSDVDVRRRTWDVRRSEPGTEAVHVHVHGKSKITACRVPARI